VKRANIEYTVICEDANYPFMTQMRHMIEDGWEPLGSVQIVRELDPSFGTRYYQAMIRRTRKSWWRFWE